MVVRAEQIAARILAFMPGRVKEGVWSRWEMDLIMDETDGYWGCIGDTGRVSNGV